MSLNLFGNFSFRTGYFETRCFKSRYYSDLKLVTCSITRLSNRSIIRTSILGIVANVGLAEHPFALQMHGFYADFRSKTLSFDIVLDFDCPNSNAEYQSIYAKVHSLFPDWKLSITVDSDFSD